MHKLTVRGVSLLLLALAPVSGFVPSVPLVARARTWSNVPQHRCFLRPSRAVLALKMYDGPAEESGEKYAETVAELIRKYKGYLEGTIDTNGEVLPEWKIDNRQIKLEAQGISFKSIPRRAREAIERTRKKYYDSFLADGNSPEKAENRVDEFLSNPKLCVDIIWEAERQRFVEEEKGLDARAKNFVTLGNILILPLVLLFLNSLPWSESFEAAKFYLSNNCQAAGGIKCNGVGAQGQKFPNIIKALTPPANGGKIVREKRLPPSMESSDKSDTGDASAPVGARAQADAQDQDQEDE